MTWRGAILTLAVCAASVLPTIGQPHQPAQNGSGEVGGYVVVWEDLFDGAQLDESVWNIEVNGRGGGNRELQYYRRENVAITTEPTSGRSCLTLTARREPFEGKLFTSGRVNSNKKASFMYGKIEASICLPKGANGLWPAFWMLGGNFDEVSWPRCGEIDILEMGNCEGYANGTQETLFNGACHWGFRRDGVYPNYARFSVAPYSLQGEGFHLYTLIWDEGGIKMYLDLDKDPAAQPYFSMKIEESDDEWATARYFRHDFFLLFNLAVGGNYTRIWEPEKITAVPAGVDVNMYVDYVKVYQKQK